MKIRMRTYGLPKTVARMHDSESVWAPESWLAPMLPSIAHGFPARRLPNAHAVTTLGEFLVTMLASLHQVQ